MSSQSMAILLKQKRETPLSRALKRFAANRGALVGLILFSIILFCIVFYPLFVPHKPNAISLTALNRPPGGTHLMGTDGVGRDILARTLEGGRISLMVGLGAAALSLAIGFFLGSVAAMGAGGKKGRWLDGLIMRFVDLTMTLPPIVLLLVLSSMAGQGVLPTILVIGGLAWPVLARMVRARLLELRERDFVLAARGLGAGNWYILFRHGLPGVMDILIVFSTMQVASAILLEAGLSFIGLGIPPPAASWGNMLNAARSTAVLEQYPWQWLFPGLVLALTVLTLNFIGDGLRDAFDPRSELIAK